MLVFVLSLLSACSGGGATSGNRWTVMVYMAADNDLEAAANLDLREMVRVGSTPNVTLVVQYDTRSTQTRRYLIESGKMTLLEDLGEQDMATPGTLKDFIVSGVTHYPADHYALILWDHGNGWQTGVDKKVSSLIEDWSNGATKSLPMTNRQVADGMLAAEALTGVHLDIMGVDACIMATIEAAYEFRNAAEILVASQDQVQGFGWDYLDLFSRLTANPRMTPRELAVAMVESYRQFAESSAWGYGDQTISAIALGSGLKNLAVEIDALARVLMVKMNDPLSRDEIVKMIYEARATAQNFQLTTYVDLQDFALKLEPAASTTQLRAVLASIIIDSYRGSKRPDAYGISIVFIDLPEALRYSAYNFDYTDVTAATGRQSQTAFIHDFMWDEMMNDYFTRDYPNLIR
jgi:hypothetical protein